MYNVSIRRNNQYNSMNKEEKLTRTMGKNCKQEKGTLGAITHQKTVLIIIMMTRMQNIYIVEKQNAIEIMN